MARGRKRKVGKREASGKPQRAPAGERADAIRGVVLAQPHRRGNTDQRAESPWGRFCLRAGPGHRPLDREIYDAGEQYAGLKRRWRAARGVPTDLRLGVGGSGDGPSDITVAQWARTIARVEHAMARETVPGFLAIRGALFDHADIGLEYQEAAVVAAEVMAAELGMMAGKKYGPGA